MHASELNDICRTLRRLQGCVRANILDGTPCMYTHIHYNHHTNVVSHSCLNPNFLIADGDNMYWSAEPVKANPTTIVNNVPFMLPREFPSAHECKAVQATAFALLVYIQNNRFTDSRPIMLWLQTMRNYDGGFATSQVCIDAHC